MKNNYLLLFLFIATMVCLVLIYFLIYYLSRKKSFFPFAFLPEINISQQPLYVSNFILSKTIPDFKIPDQDQNMINGRYERYPLGKPVSDTSIVAISPSLENFPLFTAWNIEVDIDAWNFVWCDSGSSYFCTPISLESTPLVVLKGAFPFCRYFSIYSYAGIEFTDSGDKLFGQGIAQDGYNVCNASLKEGNLRCEGFRDYEIHPDEGSKNPFTDPTFNEDLDEAFYTIYIKSPYYEGPMPSFKNINIIPLSIYGAKTAILVYRLYSPFNPKTCQSQFYWDKVSFDSLGCDPTVVKQLVVRQNGGAADPAKDSTSSCANGDRVCYNKCIQDKMAHSNVTDCYQYAGNNLFCICQKPQTACYKHLDHIINQCTNGKGTIDNFCAQAPNKSVDACLANIKCAKGDTTCQNYVKTSNVQQCTAEKLLASANNDCFPYKNPDNVCQLCKGYKDFVIDANGDYVFKDGSCQKEFQEDLKQCSEKYDMKLNMPTYCKFKCADPPQPLTMEPPLAYNPQYNFNMTPLYCCNDRYDCIDGNCFPSKDGPFTDETCSNQCYYGCKETPSPTPVTRSHVPSTPSPTPVTRSHVPSTPSPTPVTRSHVPSTPSPTSKTKYVRENFVRSTTPRPSSVPPCVFKKDAKKCDLNALRYKDIGLFGINSVPPEKIFRQGWVDLPQCFLKYNFNNYFIKLNTWNLQKLWKLSLFKSLSQALKDISARNPINPNQENFTYDIINEMRYDNIDEIVHCISNTISSNNYNGDVNACFNNFKTLESPQEILPDFSNDENCAKWVDKDNYFYVGAEFPYGNMPIPDGYGDDPPDITCPSKKIGYDKDGNTQYKTYKSAPPFCNYYMDKCQCSLHQDSLNNCCEFSLGRLSCSGAPCFVKWSHQQQRGCLLPFVYDGIAQPFAASANTGNVIPFPNPDASYLGCCTNYESDSVYVIWTDLPSFPHTPGFKSLLNNDYDLRYISFGHYCWNMTALNPKPVLSDLVDYEIKTIPVTYVDEYTQKSITANRCCIILATIEQYSYMTNYDLWDSDLQLNWLNWGKVTADVSSPNTDNLSVPSTIPIHLDDIQIPKKGILLYRQLFPSQTFKEAIQNFDQTDCSKNVKRTVITNFESSNMYIPREIPKYCNPGPGLVTSFDKIANEKDEQGHPFLGQELCKAYGLDPCCLSKNVLYFTKNYYPRCEKIKICDIESVGKSYWSRYFQSLPYKFDDTDVPAYVP